MAGISFRNIQLYRTTPLLSGNMQWDLVLSSLSPTMMTVDAFHISPISDLIPYTYRKDEYLLATTHQHNIKTFYERTKSNFFSPVAPADLVSDWPIERKDEKNWDDTYWAGAKRIDRARYDRTVSVLVPVWIEQASGFRFTITVSNGRDAQTKTVEIRRSSDPRSFHDEFGNYIYDYLNHIGITPEQGGNSKCISVNFKDGQARITGLDVSTGILETKSIDQLARNLLYRERPLLENNTRICDVYKTSNIIAPQLMNFNLLFNISDFFDDQPGDYKISVTTSAVGAGDEMEVMDLFTNHHFIPRPEFLPLDNKNPYVLQDTNALDYLKDYTITDIIHSNKIVQPVCHWVYQDNRSHLFNVYDGFGNFSRGADGKKTFSPHIYDNASPSTAPISQRSWWTDKVFYSKEEIQSAIASPADHLQALSGFVGNNKYKLNPNNEDFRVGLGLVSVKGDALGGGSPVKDALITDKTFGMFLGRWDNAEGKDSIINLQDWQDAQSSYGLLQMVPEFDGARDIRYYRDISDKYMPSVMSYYKDGKFRNENGDWVDFIVDGKDNEPKMGNYYNDYLMITYSIEPKVTNVIFWIYRFTPAGMKTNTSVPSIGIHDVILKAVNRYMRYYAAIGALSGEVQSLLERIIYALTQPILPPEVIYFRKSVIPLQDNTLSDTAQENKYYKDNDVNKYVFRYSGDIVPAMFAPVHRTSEGGQYTYENRLGRNFLWVKDYYDRNDRDNRYNRFAYTNLAPRYPSLSYDSVLLYTADGDGTINYIGPPPFVTSRPGGEYKWFSESSMKNLPTEITFTLNGENKDDRDTIISHARNEAQSRLGAYGLPSSRVFELYNIEYEYLRMHKLSSGVLAADYKVIIKLK